MVTATCKKSYLIRMPGQNVLDQKVLGQNIRAKTSGPKHPLAKSSYNHNNQCVYFYFRYTTTANNYISNISSVLKDPSPLLRKQTVTLITRLLQEDFLKWKGALFYRFIPTIFDECEDIRKFSKFHLEICLSWQVCQQG